MLTEEDDVEIHALHARGWTVAAIAGTPAATARRSASTWPAEGAGSAGSGRRVAWSRFATTSRRGSSTIRTVDATVLFRELVDAGFDRSYPTLVRELRRLELRPVCLVCEHRRGRAVTVEIEHPAGRGDPVGLAGAARHAVG